MLDYVMKNQILLFHKLTSLRELLPLHICECGQSKYHDQENNAYYYPCNVLAIEALVTASMI